jgi:hypothetical protein
MRHGHGHGHGLFIKTRVAEKFTPFPRRRDGRVPAVTPTCSEPPYMKCCLSPAPHSTYWSQAESQIWFPNVQTSHKLEQAFRSGDYESIVMALSFTQQVIEWCSLLQNHLAWLPIRVLLGAIYRTISAQIQY